jgi:hypothetical protein
MAEAVAGYGVTTPVPEPQAERDLQEHVREEPRA